MCKHLKDTAVNLTHPYTNGGSPEITSTVPLIMNSMLSLLPKHKEFKFTYFTLEGFKNWIILCKIYYPPF